MICTCLTKLAYRYVAQQKRRSDYAWIFALVGLIVGIVIGVLITRLTTPDYKKHKVIQKNLDAAKYEIGTKTSGSR